MVNSLLKNEQESYNTTLPRPFETCKKMQNLLLNQGIGENEQ
jgi:hypothetical protein